MLHTKSIESISSSAEMLVAARHHVVLIRHKSMIELQSVAAAAVTPTSR